MIGIDRNWAPYSHFVMYDYVMNDTYYLLIKVRKWASQALQHEYRIGASIAGFKEESDMMLFMLRW